MKTPREVVLESHRAVGPKLDKIRRATVVNLRGHLAWKQGSLPVQIALNLWRELIWPCRRTWAGLAAAWLVIAIANLKLSGGQSAGMATDTRPSSDTVLAWREQERVLAEIVGRTEPTMAEPPKRTAPQPRSERPDKWATA